MDIPGGSLSNYFAKSRTMLDTIDSLVTANPPAPKDEVRPVAEKLGDFVLAARASEHYFSQLKAVRQQFADWLLASPEFHENLANWGEMDEETQKIPFLQSVINKLAEFQSAALNVKVTPAPVTYYFNDSDNSTDGFMNYKIGDYTDADLIGINTKPPATPNSPDRSKDLLETIRTIAHEQWHFANISLNRAVWGDRIKEDHPLYTEAVYFHNTYREAAYISAAYDRHTDPELSPYRCQLDERSAFKFGDGVYNILRDHVISGPQVRPEPAPRPQPRPQYGEQGAYLH